MSPRERSEPGAQRRAAGPREHPGGAHEETTPKAA